ncbi:hypothetical protein BJF79_42945 [Actinomadura sp. CNU-125]|nr:hypothetical protein BJF79_42945 [Actinomadura sp. CNU-125]
MAVVADSTAVRVAPIAFASADEVPEASEVSGVGAGWSGSVPMMRHHLRPSSSIVSASVSSVVCAMCHSAASAASRVGPRTPVTVARNASVSVSVRIPASVRASSSAAARPAFQGVIGADSAPGGTADGAAAGTADGVAAAAPGWWWVAAGRW